MLIGIVEDFVPVQLLFGHSGVNLPSNIDMLHRQFQVNDLSWTHDHKTAIGFQRKTDWNDSKLNSQVLILGSREFLNKLAIPRLWLLEEGRYDLLYILCCNLRELPVFLLFLMKQLPKPRTNILNLSFLISNTNQRCLSHFMLAYVGYE